MTVYPPQFDYYPAESIDHALELLEEHPDAELLAGGHSLLPMMKSGLASPETLIDLTSVDDLHGIDAGEDAIRVGAMTTDTAIADSQRLWNDVSVVGEAASEVGDRQVRNKGTIGGNIAHADPASDLPAAVLAADATIHARGPNGDRTIPAAEFFVSMYTTELAEDELLTAIELPNPNAECAGAYVKKPSPSSGYALVGVAVHLETDGAGAVTSARIAANGVSDHAVRLDHTEDELVGNALDDAAIAEAASRATDGLDGFMVMDDLQASDEYRGHLLGVYTERALSVAADRIGRDGWDIDRRRHANDDERTNGT